LIAIRALYVCCVLLACITPDAALAGHNIPADKIEQVKEEIAKLDADVPVLVTLQSGCQQIAHLKTDMTSGVIILMGGKGHIAGHRPGKREVRWPRLVGDKNIVDGLLHEPQLGQESAGVFIATSDGVVHLFKRGEQKAIYSFPDDPMWAEESIHAVCVTKDAGVLAVAGGSGRVRLYDTATGEEKAPFTKSTSPITAVAFTPNGEKVVCGNAKGEMFLFSVDDPASAKALSSHEDRINALAVDDDNIAYSASADGSVRSLSLDAQQVLRSVRPFDQAVSFMQFAYNYLNQPHMVVATANGHASLIEPQTLKIKRVIADAEQVSVTAVDMDLFARFIAIAYSDGKVRRWHVGRVLAGDQPEQDYTKPIPFVESDYQLPGARLGMKLQKADKGFRVLGYLLGAYYHGDAPMPGDVIRTFYEDHKYKPLRDPATDIPESFNQQQPFVVQYWSRKKKEEVEGYLVFYPQPKTLYQQVARLQSEEPDHELGLAFLWSGYVHRVYPGSAAEKAGLRIGDVLRQINGKDITSSYRAIQSEVRQGRPVDIQFKRGGQLKEIQVAPGPIHVAVKQARLGMLYRLGGYPDAAQRYIHRALDAAPDDFRIYTAAYDPLLDYEDQNLQSFGKSVMHGDEGLTFLEQAVANVRYPLPLVDRLAVEHAARHMEYLLHNKKNQILDTIAALGDVGKADHRLLVHQAEVLSSDDVKKAVKLIPRLQKAVEHGDPRAAEYLDRILSRARRYEEAVAVGKKAESLIKAPKNCPEYPSF